MVKLLDFYADWCAPCRITTPIIEEIEKERTDITVQKVDVDKEPQIAEKYGVMSIPTFIVEKDGKEVGRITGATSKAKILELLN